MDLENSFVVEAPIADVWDAFLEPDRVAPCFPGATLTGSDASSFTGTVKVKLGPIAMLYKGTGTYVETDQSARKAVIKANGKDSRGNGQANATVTMTLSEASATSTQVVVNTDMSITGKPAQLGRGIISEVAGKIIGQFATCLGQRLGAESAADDSAGSGPAAAEPEATALATNGVAVPTTPGGNAAQLGAAASASTSGTSGTSGGGTGTSGGTGTGTAEAGPTQAPSPKPRPQVDYPPTPDAIDLLDSGGSAVVKRIAPVAAGAVLGGLLVWLITRG